MIVASIMMGRALTQSTSSPGSYGSLQKARLARQQLNALFFEQPQPPEKPDLPRPLPSIKAANLSVGPFGTSTPLVKGLNFTVRPGEALGIIGPSGSGKSSIAKTLAGIWPTLTGELRLGGATFNQWDQDVFGRFVGYMPQQPSLFQGTVAENIARFDPEATMAQVVAAAELAGAHEMILELPRGYETEIGHGANEVSGGQALRISLARALFGDPVLVILDEPNSFLDGQGEQALFKAIRTVKERGATVVIVAHSPAIILDCETTLVIVDGYQQEFGPTKEIVALEHPGAHTSGGANHGGLIRLVRDGKGAKRAKRARRGDTGMSKEQHSELEASALGPLSKSDKPSRRKPLPTTAHLGKRSPDEQFRRRVSRSAWWVNSVGLAVVLVFLVGSGFWAANTEVFRRRWASGELTSKSGRKTIEHFKGGVVSRIHVNNGDTVEEGALLIKLDNVSVLSEIEIVEK